MTLYSASEIVKKIDGVTTRQILDIAEKGLIIPARETTGAGSPRLYDFQNIFEICICLTVRGRISALRGKATQELISSVLRYIRKETARFEKMKKKTVKRLMENATSPEIRELLEFEAQEVLKPKTFRKPPFDILLIDYGVADKYQLTGCSYSDKLGSVLTDSKRYQPQNYCTYNVEVLKLWKHLSDIFIF